MPYIKEQDRDRLFSGGLELPKPRTAGELNYIFTCLIDNYLGNGQNVSYQRINDCIGALEGAKLELYRRVATPYEIEKCNINGDVYSKM
jgi:hypothetical protein